MQTILRTEAPHMHASILKLALHPIPPALRPAAPHGRSGGRTRSWSTLARAGMAEHFKYTILGGGNAAGYAAKEFVAGGLQPGELCIVTDEPVVSYERPALSKGYLAAEGAARLPGFHTCVGGGGDRQTAEFYKEKGIDFKTSTQITGVDLQKKTLTTAGGAMITFDKLIIATGARPVYLSDMKIPGSELQGVHYLRNERDAAALVDAIQGAKQAGQQAVVIGGGYIGMEVTAGLTNNGIPTTMVFPEEYLLSRLFTRDLAQFYEDFYAAKGIKLMKRAKVTAVEGEGGKVTHVVVENEDKSTIKVPCSLVVVGIGARPNVELFASQLETADPPVGGIKVDENLRTSVPDVYAIGDVAAFPLQMAGGKLMRQEHVTHCRTSAAHAVQHILGTAKGSYNYLPYFYSRIFNLSWQFWGSQGDDSKQVVLYGSQDVKAPKFGAYFVSGGKVVGAFVESASPEEANALKRIALDQPPAPGNPEELKSQGLAFATSRL